MRVKCPTFTWGWNNYIFTVEILDDGTEYGSIKAEDGTQLNCGFMHTPRNKESDRIMNILFFQWRLKKHSMFKKNLLVFVNRMIKRNQTAWMNYHVELNLLSKKLTRLQEDENRLSKLKESLL